MFNQLSFHSHASILLSRVCLTAPVVLEFDQALLTSPILGLWADRSQAQSDQQHVKKRSE